MTLRMVKDMIATNKFLSRPQFLARTAKASVAGGLASMGVFSHIKDAKRKVTLKPWCAFICLAVMTAII